MAVRNWILRRLSRITIGIATLAALIMMPTPASAQSAIAGLVKDNSGAVLPGVTVEAASSALIEGKRAAVTDGQGRFSIVDLRPGVYTVPFSLEGFNRSVREGIELSSNFTATVDGTLSVGSLQESVTVSGAAPLLDVRQSNTTQTLSRALLDSLPIGRSIWEQGNLVSGVRMTGTDPVAGASAATEFRPQENIQDGRAFVLRGARPVQRAERGYRLERAVE